MESTQVIVEKKNSSLIAGIITGQIAGLIMAVVIILVFMIVYNKTFYFPVQVIGSTFFGEEVLVGFHLNAFLTGLLLHQGVALLWGAIYGLVIGEDEIPSSIMALAFGIVLGVVSMLGPYLLIPFVMNTFQGVDIWNREVPMMWDWAAHIVFGAAFVVYPLVRKNVSSAP